MSHIIPFESAALPAHIAARFAAKGPSALSANVGASFGSISIKGKVFHIVRGDDRQLVRKPGDDEPAGSMEVVILAANPNLSKVYYPSGYEEGSTEKPTCYSNNGSTPASDAAQPQAKSCAACVHNQWGSRVTDNGGKGKACSDSRRLAVCGAGTPGDPLLLRVPAASLKTLAIYGDQLAARGVDFTAVVTKIGFDYTVAHPSLTFKPVGFIDAAMAEEVLAAQQSESVKAILGDKGFSDHAPATPAPQAAPAPTPAPAPAAAEEAPKKRGRPAKTAEDVEDAKPAPTPAPAAAPVLDNAAVNDISAMLAGMDFDD